MIRKETLLTWNKGIRTAAAVIVSLPGIIAIPNPPTNGDSKIEAAVQRSDQVIFFLDFKAKILANTPAVMRQIEAEQKSIPEENSELLFDRSIKPVALPSHFGEASAFISKKNAKPSRWGSRQPSLRR